MEIHKYPEQGLEWSALLARPQQDDSELIHHVQHILNEVYQHDDEALFYFANQYDHVTLSSLLVSNEEIELGTQEVDQELKDAIQVAYNNIYQFHKQQEQASMPIETTKGVICWRKSIGIDTVGLYIPGGSAPLFSTVLMLAIPATIAGCKHIYICTPPNSQGKIHPAILYTANLCGITEIYKVGGAQAVAAMAYGTTSIPKANKIFGPGNRYVTLAKQLVNTAGIAIDMPAGPSEVLVIADEYAPADFVAADLLAQAEHGTDSQVILLTNSEQQLDAVAHAIAKQLETLPRRAIAEKALENSRLILLNDLEECISFSNLYAPEHLIIQTQNADYISEQVINAGSVFIGNYTPESAGDYASGTNHTLPTNGYASSYSGVSLDSFVKKITFQKITKEGLSNLASTIEIMATHEELIAHKNSVSIRLKQ